MRRAVFALDGSAAMNAASDLKPTRLLGLWPALATFLRAYLEADPVSRVSVLVGRDGVAQRITNATSNADDVVAVVDREYVAPQGSGTFSLDNLLRTAIAEFTVDGRSHGDRTLIIVSGSVSSVDAGDVFDAIDRCVDVGITCHAVAMDGASHVLQVLTAKTGGQLLCPMNAEHLARLLFSLCPSAEIPTRTATASRTVVAGFVDDAATAAPRCPLCQSLVRTLPGPCAVCGACLVKESEGCSSQLTFRSVAAMGVEGACAACGVTSIDATAVCCGQQLCAACCDTAADARMCVACGV